MFPLNYPLTLRLLKGAPKMMTPFIDISSHQQGPVGIDWPAVAAYLLAIDPEAGVIIKVSEGTNYVNPFLHQQRMGAHAAGIKNVGLYHFCRPSLNSGHVEADYFMKAIGDDGGILTKEFGCLDIEDTNVPPQADLDAYVLDFAGRIQRPWGIPVTGYTGQWYADPHNLNHDPALAVLGLWWMDVTSKTLPVVPEPWKSAGKSILFWQWNWYGSVPGIVGNVDLDFLVGGIDALRPYQWGMQPDPLLGYVDVPLDVNVSANSESRQDQDTVLNAIAQHATTLLTAPQGANRSDDAQKMKSEVDWFVRSTWGH